MSQLSTSLSSERDLDLSLIPDLHTYLENHQAFQCTTIEVLSGGLANFTFRLHLREPFEGRPSLVLKHAKNYVAFAKDIPFGVERQLFEVEALKRVRDWLPEDSVVNVPAVHLYDDKFNVIIMDDCGSASTLKELMLAGKISVPLAEEIGNALGVFLRRLHDWGTHTPSVAHFFEGNKQAKILSIWMTYGQLVSTLTGNELPKLVGLEIPSDKLEVLSKVAEHMTHSMTSATSTFVMGDFWPGNMIITFDAHDALRRIDVLDWEAAKPGLPGAEVGQFCGEMHQVQMCYPQYAPSASRTIDALLSTYMRGQEHDSAAARDALIHCGAHLIVWTPRVPWADEKVTKEVVRVGVEFVLQGFTGNPSLKDSWVAPMVVDA
ncbi:kinase-like domain-containing protein [Mycena rebaudengoi]|nr:kinase-like domain-containing protein [Mycena rebaudengoi]